MDHLHLPLLYLLLAAAAASDTASRRVPNAIPAAMAVLAVAAQLSAGGVRAACLAIGAAALVLAMLLVPFSRRMLGGGDVKLAVACAAWLGFAGLPVFLLATAIAGGAVSITAAALALRGPAAVAVDDPAATPTPRSRLRAVRVPYSIAIAIGVVATQWRMP